MDSFEETKKQDDNVDDIDNQETIKIKSLPFYLDENKNDLKGLIFNGLTIEQQLIADPDVYVNGTLLSQHLTEEELKYNPKECPFFQKNKKLIDDYRSKCHQSFEFPFIDETEVSGSGSPSLYDELFGNIFMGIPALLHTIYYMGESLKFKEQLSGPNNKRFKDRIGVRITNPEIPNISSANIDREETIPNTKEKIPKYTNPLTQKLVKMSMRFVIEVWLTNYWNFKSPSTRMNHNYCAIMRIIQIYTRMAFTNSAPVMVDVIGTDNIQRKMVIVEGNYQLANSKTVKACLQENLIKPPLIKLRWPAIPQRSPTDLFNTEFYSNLKIGEMAKRPPHEWTLMMCRLNGSGEITESVDEKFKKIKLVNIDTMIDAFKIIPESITIPPLIEEKNNNNDDDEEEKCESISKDSKKISKMKNLSELKFPGQNRKRNLLKPEIVETVSKDSQPKISKVAGKKVIDEVGRIEGIVQQLRIMILNQGEMFANFVDFVSDKFNKLDKI